MFAKPETSRGQEKPVEHDGAGINVAGQECTHQPQHPPEEGKKGILPASPTSVRDLHLTEAVDSSDEGQVLDEVLETDEVEARPEASKTQTFENSSDFLKHVLHQEFEEEIVSSQPSRRLKDPLESLFQDEPTEGTADALPGEDLLFAEKSTPWGDEKQQIPLSKIPAKDSPVAKRGRIFGLNESERRDYYRKQLEERLRQKTLLNDEAAPLPDSPPASIRGKKVLESSDGDSHHEKVNRVLDDKMCEFPAESFGSPQPQKGLRASYGPLTDFPADSLSAVKLTPESSLVDIVRVGKGTAMSPGPETPKQHQDVAGLASFSEEPKNPESFDGPGNYPMAPRLTSSITLVKPNGVVSASLGQSSNVAVAVSMNGHGSSSEKPIGIESRDCSGNATVPSIQKTSSSDSSEKENVTSKGVPRTTNVKHPVTTHFFSMSTMLAIVAFRILNTFLIQSYFDPDEFWQNLEPAYCHTFRSDDSCGGWTWEWTRRTETAEGSFIENSLYGPIRSFVSIVPTLAVYKFAQVFDFDSHWLISRGPILVNAVAVAAPVDIAVFCAASWLAHTSDSKRRSSLPFWCMFCNLISWFNGFSLVRTFGNSQEVFFLIVAVALVSPELLGNCNARRERLRSCLAFLLGGVSVAVRFTSLAAFVPIGVALSARKRSISRKLWFLIFPCAMFGLLGLGISVLVDRYFYGFWAIPFLGSFHFNVLLNNASLYGTHETHWYLTAGLPAVAGILLPLLLWDLASFRRDASYGRRNLWLIIICYVTTMSFNVHKEFRFIHPVLPLICLLSGKHLQSLVSNSRIRRAMITTIAVLANLAAVAYLGLFHQRGPVEVNHTIVSMAQELPRTHYKVHYLTGQCHSTPLLSHLHAASVSFDTWSLDCSPSCRASPDVDCETDLFTSDPVSFVGMSYFGWSSNDGENSSCLAEGVVRPRDRPDFVVSYSKYASLLEAPFRQMGLQEVARFPYQLVGINLWDKVKFGAQAGDRTSVYRTILLWEEVEITLDEVVLFAMN